MAISSESGEFNYSVTSSTFSASQGGGTEVVINVEGDVSGFGQMNGTLTMVAPAPGVNAGSVSFRGAAFVDGGEVIGTTAEGHWAKLDSEHKWRVRGINLYSNGEVNLSDGTLDLATRTFNGTLAPWT